MKRAALLLLFGCAGSAAHAAQHDSLLVAAVRLATEGRGDSARALVERLLSTVTPSDSLYSEALFTLGVVSTDADEAMRAFRRVAVEFGLSPWGDDAILRLIQLSYVGGDPGTTVSWHDRLRRDYPASPLLAEGAYWAARAHFDLRDEAAGCATLTQGLTSTGADVEIKNRIAFYQQRCAARPDSGPAPPARTPAPPAARFSVQVMAVKSVAAADDMLTRLRAAGFEGGVVRDQDGLLKVRVGRFATRPEAVEMAGRIRQRLGGQPFVVEVKP